MHFLKISNNSDMQIFYLFHFYTMDRTQINVALSMYTLKSINWGGGGVCSQAVDHQVTYIKLKVRKR